MRTARPAARSPDAFFELRAHPFDMLPPCLHFLDGNGPANPLVASERRYVFPGRQCLRVGRERLSKISRKIMCDSSQGSSGCHRVISQGKDQASDTRVQHGFSGNRGISRQLWSSANTASSGSPSTVQGFRRAFKSQCAPVPTDLDAHGRSGPRDPPSLLVRGASHALPVPRGHRS